MMFMSDTKGSGGIEYTLKDGALSEDWRYGFTKSSFSLGQALPLSNNDVFVNYGSEGMLQEVTRDGTVVWEATLSGSGPGAPTFGQFQLLNTLYSGS
jgi:hypothetical protein